MLLLSCNGSCLKCRSTSGRAGGGVGKTRRFALSSDKSDPTARLGLAQRSGSPGVSCCNPALISPRTRFCRAKPWLEIFDEQWSMIKRRPRAWPARSLKIPSHLLLPPVAALTGVTSKGLEDGLSGTACVLHFLAIACSSTQPLPRLSSLFHWLRTLLLSWLTMLYPQTSAVYHCIR